MAAPESRIKIKTVEGTSYVALPFAKPEYFGQSKIFRFRIKWGDGQTNVYLNSYDHEFLDWDRDYDSSGDAQNPVPTSDEIVVPFHNYETPGQYTIEVFGGFGYNEGESNNDDEGGLKIAFATSDDRKELYHLDAEGKKIIDRFCRGTPDAIEEIIGIGKASKPRGGMLIHGQGDFEDFTNLKVLNCKLGLLTSDKNSASDMAVSYDSAGKITCKNTFKNCESLKKSEVLKVDSIKTLFSGPAKVLSLEGIFDNCSYNDFIGSWNTSLCENWNKAFSNTKFTEKVILNMDAAKSLDYTFENSYVGRVFKIKQSFFKGDAAISASQKGGATFFKFVIADSSGNTLWSHDGSSTVGSAVAEPSSSIRLITKGGNGKTKDDFFLGDPKLDGMDLIDPDIFLQTGTRIHFWVNHKNGGSYTKYDIGIDYDAAGKLVIANDQTYILPSITNVSTAIGTFKDHKKLDPNLLRRAFPSATNIDSMEAFFEGTKFLKEKSRFKLRFNNAKPKSLSKYIRNSEYAPDIRFIDTSRLEDISHMCQDTDYDQNLPFKMDNVTNASYAFAGCTGNPYLHALFKKKGGDSRTFQPINVEGMFEGSSGWSGQDWPWRHMHPTSLERTFRNCDFNGQLFLGSIESCTSLNSTFRNSSFVNTNTNIGSWDVRNVEDTSYCFAQNEGTWSVASWFKDHSTKTYKIKKMDSMFEGSKNATAVTSWRHALNKTVVSARAMFKNNKSVSFNDIVQIFRNTTSTPAVIEEIDSIFEGINLTVPVNDTQRRYLKQWKLAKADCEQHVDVFKGVSFNGPVTAESCRLKNFETGKGDSSISPITYKAKKEYTLSEILYLTLCPERPAQQGDFDTVFMKVG